MKRYPQIQSQNNLSSLHPTSTVSSQIAETKTTAKPTPEEITKSVKKFDDEANTEADLSVDKNSVHKSNEVNACISSIKPIIDSMNTINLEINDDRSSHNASDKANRASAKSELHEICAANKWKPPFFECYKEEGPSHLRLFTFEVTIEITGEHCMTLECFGAPRPKKTTAAEHAAQGALWSLKHFGYYPIDKSKKGKTKNKNKKK